MPARALSVIIPTINEAESLPRLLSELVQQKNIVLEIIVVDGGSTDATISVANSFGATVLTSAKGRARQLNAGAKVARYNTLLFLHADSGFTGDDCLARAMDAFQVHVQQENGQNVAGHFALHFVRQYDSHNLSYRFLEAKTTTNRPQTINGDQGLLINKTFFTNLDGYKESMAIMEDQDIAARIFSQGKWVLLPGTICTSARRFECEGFHRRYILMSLMMGLYWTGVEPFFARAKNVYAEQSRTTQLKLWPFFACIWQMLINDFGWKQSLRQWYKVGCYVRQNSWQLFFFIDVALQKESSPKAYPLTGFHDRLFYPLTNNVVCNILVTPVVFVWYMLILGPWFYIWDK